MGNICQAFSDLSWPPLVSALQLSLLSSYFVRVCWPTSSLIALWNLIGLKKQFSFAIIFNQSRNPIWWWFPQYILWVTSKSSDLSCIIFHAQSNLIQEQMKRNMCLILGLKRRLYILLFCSFGMLGYSLIYILKHTDLARSAGLVGMDWLADQTTILPTYYYYVTPFLLLHSFSSLAWYFFLFIQLPVSFSVKLFNRSEIIIPTTWRQYLH